MNAVWLGMWLTAVAAAAVLQKFDVASAAMFEGARSALDVTLALTANMALWLGLLAVLQRAGAIDALSARAVPVLRRLLPGLPKKSEAPGLVAMNLSATMLGLSNAATPFGLQAMRALQAHNPKKDRATAAMAMFLVLNTSGVQLIPTSVIAVRQALGSKHAGAIIVPSFVATLVSMLIAIVLCLLLQRWWGEDSPNDYVEHPPTTMLEALSELSPDLAPRSGASPDALSSRAPWLPWLTGLGLIALFLLRATSFEAVGNGLPIVLFVLGLVFAWSQRVPLYETFVEGAKEGPLVALRVLPFLVAMLSAVQVFRALGAFTALQTLIPANDWLPASVLPQVLLRPLTGSGTLGLLTETLKNEGPDSYAGHVASILYGSSETTFYVLAVYFGSVGITKWRHTLLACLLADAVSALLAVVCAHFSYVFLAR